MTKTLLETPDPAHRDSCLIVHPEVYNTKSDQTLRNLDETLQEAEGLARAINLDIIDTLTFKISRIQAGAFLGKGQRQSIKDAIADHDPDVVIVNHSLSPVQQRNLEREWDVKVIDRTGLILEIFGARAQTKEGRLQVELAALEYQRSRLVRSWTHLERQRGGAGFMGGPGETQIEIDRRLISERIINLKKELENVRRTRELGRKARERVPFPVIALVGYTNAGKSTLFNTLTNAKVFAKDLLFATLDPTLRRLALPSGQKVILSDTVGFISDLPTHLIEAFRATLEQTVHADVILHVIDVFRPDYAAQRRDVLDILKDLGIEEEDERIIEVWNKADLLSKDDYADFARKEKFQDNAVTISAVTGLGLESLVENLSRSVSRKAQEITLQIDVRDGKALAWLYSHAEILEREDHEDNIALQILIEPGQWGKFCSQYPYRPDNKETV